MTYRIVAEFTPDEAVRFGMSALLTAGREEEPETQELQEETDEQPTEKKTEEADEESSGKKHRERPEGMSEWNGEGERPERPEGSRPGRSSETEEASGETAEGEAAVHTESTEAQ